MSGGVRMAIVFGLLLGQFAGFTADYYGVRMSIVLALTVAWTIAGWFLFAWWVDVHDRNRDAKR